MNPLPQLAFGFASPWLLWGLALGGIPIVIHLLHKRRYREMPWAAMRFLLDAARKNSRRIRLEQLLLLIVRTLILVLLALALSEPYVETFGTYFQAERPTHRIIVIDASFSMGFQPAEFSRFDRAKQIARDIVAGAKQGDALNLVRICDSPPRAIVRQPAFQKSQVDAEIEQLALTDEPGDLFATLRQVSEILREAPGIKRKEVYFVSDFQLASWSPDSSGRKAQIRGLLKQLSGKASLTLIDLGQPHTPNAAVTRFEMQEPLLTVGQRVHLRVTLRNFGDTPLTGQLLELYVNDRVAETQRVDLPPGARSEAFFLRSFDSSGEYKLEVRLENDPLGVDNRQWLILPVKDALDVLLVNGKRSGRLMAGATDHLKLALSPSLQDVPWRGLIRPHTIDDGELEQTDLSHYDCIFLCNVRLFTDREADVLQAYVESGGAVVFALGDQVQADNYNRMLFRDGKGILPAKLGDRIAATDENGGFFSFDPGNFSHSIVGAFRGNLDAGLETTRTSIYVRATVPEKLARRVALRFSSGDPAIVEAAVGRGRSFLLTTSLDRQWGTWVLWPSFPPLMHELVRYAAGGHWGRRQLTVGDPLVQAYSSRAFDMPVTLKLPDGSEKSIRLTEVENTSRISYGATYRSGVYEIALGSPPGRRELFAVNVDPRESDPVKVHENELQAELLAGIDFVYRTNWQDFRRDADVAVAERGGMTRWLLLAVLCLTFVEQLMAWRFFYGFLLLYAVVACGFVRQTLSWDVLYGSLLLFAFAAGFAIIVSIHSRNPARQ